LSHGVGSNKKLYVVNFFIVLDGWKRFVKVVKKFLPLLGLIRLTKPYGVILQFLPLYQKDVSVFFFNAILKFERYKARHRSNNGFRFPEGVLKCRFLTGLNVEDRDF